MGKPRGPDRVYPQALKLAAVERMETARNITALSRELGIPRTLLYFWRSRYRAEGAEPLDPRDPDVDRQVPFVFREQLLQVSPKVRHDPMRTALAILRAYETWRFSPRRGAGSDFA